MKTRNRISYTIYLLIIMIAFFGGNTISYFTADSGGLLNLFTAGTVSVSAGDGEGHLVIKGGGENSWSPGECKELELSVKNIGSKRAYARARFEALWKASYHGNTATALAYYLPPGQLEPRKIQSSSSAGYSYGNYSGPGEVPVTPPGPSRWFTDFASTSPLGFIAASIAEQGGGGGGGGSHPGGDVGDEGEEAGFNEGMTPPTVNGLFYGDGDYLRYYPIAEVPSGTTLYAYLDEQPGGARTLYVALVVSRAVNDNVFDNSGGAYGESAGWGDDRSFFHLVNSEFMGFKLTGHNIETDQDETWDWKQCYAYQQDGNGNPKHWKDENNTSPTWASDHTFKAGTGVPPPGYISSSSLVWNLNNYALNRDDPDAPKWDVTLGGTRIRENWKSPFDPAYPNDVTKVEGYPPAGRIGFSETYGWEWPMVYEFSVDMTKYSPYTMELHNISSHHSPSKSGGQDENIEGYHKILYPHISVIKEVSLDGGSTWRRSAPWPELPDPLPQGFAPRYRFSVKNSGDFELTGITVSDDVLGPIGTVSSLAPGASHEFPVFVDADWADRRPGLEPGHVTFQLCEGAGDWVLGEDGYFYYTEPIAAGETVTLRVKACIDHELEGAYEGAWLGISSSVEAVQASHSAVDEVWPGHPPLSSIPGGPSLRVSKQADRSSAVAGDVINYTISVINNGDVTLNDIVLDDAMLGLNHTIASLTPGAARSFTGAYTVQPGDAGLLVNTATAAATGCGLSLSADAAASVSVVPAGPSLQLFKEADPAQAAKDELINYTITVINSGNVTLNNITVVDTMLGISENIAALAPGASRVFTGSRIVAAGDFPGPLVNTAAATANYGGQPLEASATAAVTLSAGPVMLFSSLDNGDYVKIGGVLFRKIGDNWALREDITGDHKQAEVITLGQNYSASFPASIRNGSRLLTSTEAGDLSLSIRSMGKDWWTGTSVQYVDRYGQITKANNANKKYGFRPMLILKPGLAVEGGSGTLWDPYILVAP